MAKLNIVLLEPEIPANTGNIGRTCVATDTKLHLIEPLGFSLSEKALKRAGMDYWKDLDVTTYLDYEDFVEKNPNAKIYYATTKALKTYTDVQYEEDCYIMFGTVKQTPFLSVSSTISGTIQPERPICNY